MKVNMLPVGLYMENCYVVHEDGHVLIVDPGGHSDIISSVIEKDEKVEAILLTHGHEDHTSAVEELVSLFHCPVYMSVRDLPLVEESSSCQHPFAQPVTSKILPVKEIMDIGGFHIQMVPTPGHTHGSVCYIIENCIFSGDTLFAGSIGRTDLSDSSVEEMRESLKTVAKFPQEYTVLPGHGSATTIRDELQSNYYLIHLSASE